MASHIDPTFDTMYGGEHATTDMVPWDIGGPQPVVQQLVAYGGCEDGCSTRAPALDITRSTVRRTDTR